MGKKRSTYRLLEGKSKRKRPFERPTCRWKVIKDKTGNVHINVILRRVSTTTATVER